MDSFELNKIIAAILMVALLVIGLGKVADGVFHVNKPENPGYQVEVEGQPACLIDGFHIHLLFFHFGELNSQVGQTLRHNH